MEQQVGDPSEGIVKKVWGKVSTGVMPLFDRLTDASIDDMHIIRREARLFLGIALMLVGFLHWSTGKYCDGNTADYLSCTRPAAYYYYGAFEIFLVVIGVFLVSLWFLRRNHQ